MSDLFFFSSRRLGWSCRSLRRRGIPARPYSEREKHTRSLSLWCAFFRGVCRCLHPQQNNQQDHLQIHNYRAVRMQARHAPTRRTQGSLEAAVVYLRGGETAAGETRAWCATRLRGFIEDVYTDCSDSSFSEAAVLLYVRLRWGIHPTVQGDCNCGGGRIFRVSYYCCTDSHYDKLRSGGLACFCFCPGACQCRWPQFVGFFFLYCQQFLIGKHFLPLSCCHI